MPGKTMPSALSYRARATKAFRGRAKPAWWNITILTRSSVRRETEAYRQTLMAASSDGTTVTTAQDKDGNTFAVRAVEGDSYALAYPVSDNGDGTVSLGAPVQRSMSDFDKGSMASAPLETYLQGLSARQRAQGQSEDAAAREQDMAASLPPIRADRPMQAVRPVTYFTTDMKKEKAAVEGSRIEAVADVPEGTAADAPVRVVVTAPNGKAEPGVMTYGQLQGMLADGTAMESEPVRRDPEHRVSVSGAAQGQQPLQDAQPSPQGTGESVAQAGTGTVSGQQPGEVNRPAQAQPAVQGQGGMAAIPDGSTAMPQGQAQPGGVAQGGEAAVPAAQAVQATAQPNVREDGMPLDEAGEPAYEQAPVQATWDDLMARNGRDEGKVRYFAQEMKAVKDRELKAERKRKPKGKNAAALQRAMDEQQAKIGRLEQESSYWDTVLSMSYRAGEAAATEGTKERQAEAGRKREASERGFPAIQARWESARKEEGMEDELMLPDGSVVGGRYYLVEAEAPTASHDPSNGFRPSEGFPVDGNGRTVNDRDYEHDRQAQENVLDKASDYDQRAMQNPVVVSRDGVVLSGNDRTMASQIAARQGTDGKYVDYLRRHPGKYGFEAGQVASYAHPRVVFVPDGEMGYDAATFARFNRTDMKTQDRTESAVKMGKTVPEEVFARIASLVNRHESIGEAYRDESTTRELVAELVSSGVLEKERVAELVDGGRLSGAGEDYVESLLVGGVLEEDALRAAMEDRQLRRAVVSAILPLVENRALKNGYSLASEISDAVKLVRDAKASRAVRFGESVSMYVRQNDLFGEDVVAEATVQLLGDVINSGNAGQLKKVLNEYNEEALNASQGQADLFAGDVLEKDVILRNVLKHYGYETRTTDTSARAAARTQRGRQEEGNPEEQAGPPVQGRAEDGDAAARTGQGGLTSGEAARPSAQEQGGTASGNERIEGENRNVTGTEDRSLEGGTPEGRKARLEERHRQRQEAEAEARERLAGLGAQDNGEPDYHRSGERGAEAPTEAEAELRDAIVGRLRASGIEVVTDSEAGQRVLDEVNERGERVRMQAMLGNLTRAANTIRGWMKNGNRGKVFSIELPKRTQRMVRKAMGRDFASHNITANGIVHALKNHGEKGKKLNERSIPIREKDAELIPYIMTAPDYVRKGSTDMTGRESVRFYKDLNNGYVVVVEKEYKDSPDDMETINMWAELSSSNVSDARTKARPLNSTSQPANEYRKTNAGTVIISSDDAAKIRKDAEDAILADGKVREHRVYHGSGADFDAFDHSHMGEGEGAQAYGWGSYVTEVEGIGRTYAEASTKDKRENKTVYKRAQIRENETSISVIKNMIAEFPEMQRKRERTLSERETEYAELRFRKEELLESQGEGSVEYRNFLFNNEDYISELERRIADSKRSIAMESEYNEQRKRQVSELEEENKRLQSEIEAIEAQYPRHLYTVEIPDDNGSNYLHWEKPVPEAQIKKIQAYLGKNYRRNKLDDFNASIAPVKTSNADEVNAWSRRGENIYKTLSHLLGSNKAASEALSEMGFTGISYPAQYLSGGRSDGARNFVIFKESDMKITGKVKFFRTLQGEAYGFTVGGKIYLDPRIAKADTPIHEYAHLWASALREGNPEEWANVAGLMKDTPVWEEVKRLYPELETDEEIADEVLATYSGRRGAERLREAMRGASGSGDLGKALSAVEAMGKVREALQRFWHAVADLLHIRYTTAEAVADRVLKDLLDGVKPGGGSQRMRLQAKDEALFSGLTPEARAEMEAIKAKAEADGTWMKAPNGKPTNLSERQWLQVRTKAFKEWFGDWEKAARIAKLRKSEPVSVEYKGEYELNRESAKEWLKGNVRDEYTNEDTGEKIEVSRVGINEVTSHGSQDEAHLKSLVAIPRMLKESIFIDEIPNAKDHDKYDSYRYYVCGLKIDEQDYTAKIVVGVKGDKKYYDHRLTQIEKGALIDNLNGLSNSVAENQNADVSIGKDTRLQELLQADASKVVDGNGEPLVVYHGSRRGGFSVFDNTKGDRNSDAPDGTTFFASGRSTAYTYSGTYDKPVYDREEDEDGYEDDNDYPSIYACFLNIRDPYVEDFEGADWQGDLYGKAALMDQDGSIVPTPEGKRFFDSAEEAEAYGESEVENGTMDSYTVQEDPWVGYSTNQFAEEARGMGCDGAVIKNVSDNGRYGDAGESTVYVAFNANQIKSATDNNGTFSAMNDDIRFRQQGGRGEATDMESKRAAVEALGRKLNVEVVFEDEASLRKQPRQYRTASGWFDRAQWRKDGRRVIHVNLSNTGDAHEAEMTVLHEAVGHMGLRELLGAENYAPFLDMVHGIIPEAQSGRLRALVFKGHPDLARRVGEGNADGKDRETAEAELRRVMADEWLAELAEVGGEPGVWEQIVESFRMLLRRLGFELSLSESDIRALLFESRRNLESSRLPGEAERIREQQEEFREAARLDRIMEADMADMEADAGSEASSFRQWYGGNSGYVGYSMSRRAAEAREEGRFPKTDFKKEYHVSEHALKALVRTGFIDGSEWHHTSKYGNRTPFYGWTDEASAQTYLDNKKEVDALSKEYDGLGMASPDNNAALFLEERKSAMRKERGYDMDFLTDGEKAERSRRLDEIGIADFGMDEAERARINAASEAVIDEYRELSGRRIREMESEIQGMDEYKNRVEEEGRKEARRKEIEGRLEEIFGQQETGPDGVLFRQGGGASARPTRSQRRQAERMFRDDKIISAGKEREWTSRQRFRHGMANLQEFFNDSVRLRYLGNHIRRMGGRVSSATDLYELATTVPAKEQYRSERFELSCGRPLVSCVREILQKTGKKVRDLELYMIAKHGPERNRWMYNRKKLGELADDMAYEVRNESGITRPLGEAAKNRIIASIMKEYGGTDSYMDAAVARKMAADIYEALSKSHAASMTQEAMKAQGKGVSLPKDNASILTQENLDGIAEKTQSSLLERAKKDTDKDKDFSGLSDFAKTTGTNPENYVARFEEEVEAAVPGGIDSFWAHLNAVTDFTLQTRLECGLMSEEAYQAIKDMGWSHYVPLRSWDARNPLSDDYMETDYKQREDSQAKVFHVSAMRLETDRAEVGTYVEKLFGEEALVDEDSRPEIILIANKEDVAYLQ